jgi:hypothetical protein
MGPFDLLLHLGGFVAPALALGLLVALVGPRVVAGGAHKYSFWFRASLLALAGVAALLIGLWLFGRDGKMATYGLFVGSAQWLMAAGWRR